MVPRNDVTVPLGPADASSVNLTTRRRLNRRAGAVNIDRRATRVKHNEQQHSGRMSMRCACANYVTSGDDDYVNVARATVAVRLVRVTVHYARLLYSTHLQIHARALTLPPLNLAPKIHRTDAKLYTAMHDLKCETDA